MKLAHYGARSIAVAGIVLAGFGYNPPALGAGGEDTDLNSGPASTFEINLDLYVGGITLGKVAMSARVKGNDYNAVSTVETRGIVNAFWQSKIEASSTGSLVQEGRVQPQEYDSFSINRQLRRQQVKLTFGPEGPKSLFSDPPYGQSDHPVTDDQQKRTLDPLSAMVFLATNTAGSDAKPCGMLAPIYDGRRRYDVVFNLVKKTDVKLDNGLYKGPALVCEIHYNQIAGYNQTLVQQGKKLPKIFAWVASLQSPTDSARRFQIPLKVWAETEYGVVTAVASSVKVDGVALGKGS